MFQGLAIDTCNVDWNTLTEIVLTIELNSDDTALDYPHKNVKGKFHEILAELEELEKLK